MENIGIPANRLQKFWKNWTRSTSVEKQRYGIEYSIKAVSLILAIVFLPVSGVIAWLWSAGLTETTSALIILAMDMLIAFNLLAAAKDRLKLARWFQVGAFLLPGVYFSLVTGITGSAILFYSVAIFLACIQFERRTRWGIVFFVMIFHTVASRLLFDTRLSDFISQAAMINTIWISLALILSLYNNALKQALSESDSRRLALQKENAERLSVEQELKRNQALLTAVIHNMPFDFWVCDTNSRYILQNPTSERHWGPAIDKKPMEMNLPDEIRTRWMVKNERALSGEIIKSEEFLTHLEGSGHYYSLLAPVRLNGEIIGCFGMNLDITDRVRAEQSLRENEERLRQVLQNMPILLDAFDENNRIIVWNRECELVTGYSAEEILSHPDPLALLYPDPTYRQQMLAKVKELDYTFRELELDITCKNGAIRTISWSNLSARFPVPGWHTWSVGVDITERKMTEQRLRYWGHHDSLTGLFNRSYFNEELGRLRVSRQFPVSIIIMDVDDLKSINDTLGHLQGDEVLRRTAEVISGCFRAEDVIARIGGDEFAVLLPFTDQPEVIHAVERIKNAIDLKNQLGEKPLLGLSIGYATAETGYELQTAYDLADISMYKDKSLRKKTGPLRGLQI